MQEKHVNLQFHSENAYADPNWKAPRIIYGNNLVCKATDTKEKYVVCTIEIPWNIVKEHVTNPPSHIIFVPNMRIETLQKIEKLVPENIEMVMGIGGGSSHDCAKYIALKKNARLVQIPTIFGGDAVVTTAIGIRKEGRVKYIAHVITDEIFVDFGILKEAPPHLVKYGAADILSSFTALLDWKIAAEKGKEEYNPEIAQFAKEKLLVRLYEEADEIKNLTEIGIKAIIELYVEYHKIAHKIATDRAQEGSEHFFAYNAEYITKRQFVHGALLSLGIWISASFIHKHKVEIEDFLKRLGLEYDLKSVNLSEQELKEVLFSLKDFTIQGGYYYSGINEVNFTPEYVENVLKSLSE